MEKNRFDVASVTIKSPSKALVEALKIPDIELALSIILGTGMSPRYSRARSFVIESRLAENEHQVLYTMDWIGKNYSCVKLSSYYVEDVSEPKKEIVEHNESVEVNTITIGQLAMVVSDTIGEIQMDSYTRARFVLHMSDLLKQRYGVDPKEFFHLAI